MMTKSTSWFINQQCTCLRTENRMIKRFWYLRIWSRNWNRSNQPKTNNNDSAYFLIIFFLFFYSLLQWKLCSSTSKDSWYCFSLDFSCYWLWKLFDPYFSLSSQEIFDSFSACWSGIISLFSNFTNSSKDLHCRSPCHLLSSSCQLF